MYIADNTNLTLCRLIGRLHKSGFVGLNDLPAKLGLQKSRFGFARLNCTASMQSVHG